jgi:hypothetical protein
MRELIPTVVVPLILVTGGLLSWLTAKRRSGPLDAVDVVRLIVFVVCAGAAITVSIIWMRASWLR